MTTFQAGPGAETMTSTVLASLPRSTRQVERDAEVLVIDGSSDWATPLAAAAEIGTRTVLVIDPGSTDLGSLRTALASRTRVVLSESIAGSPSIGAMLAATEGLQDVGAVLIEVASPGTLDTSALQALRLLRALGVREVSFRDRRSTAGAWVFTADARLGGKSVLVRALVVRTTAAAPRTTVRAYGVEVLVETTLFDATTARAGETSITSPAGRTVLPTLYETAHRRAFRTIAEATIDRALSGYVEDLMLLDALRSVRPPKAAPDQDRDERR